nr:unnamed protein product [Digitaria exilis]
MAEIWSSLNLTRGLTATTSAAISSRSSPPSPLVSKRSKILLTFSARDPRPADDAADADSAIAGAAHGKNQPDCGEIRGTARVGDLMRGGRRGRAGGGAAPCAGYGLWLVAKREETMVMMTVDGGHEG